MKIAVTGANGFLGSHLMERLLARGDEGVAVVRPRADLRWLARAREHEAFTLVRAQLDDREALVRALQGVDALCHVAGATKARPESRYHEVNVGGTQSVVEACRAALGPRRLVLCSSLSAGGPAAPDHPKRESDPDDPQSTYGRSKKAAEEIAFQAAEEGSLEVVALRPGPIYGPRDTYVLELLKPAALGVHMRVGGPSARYNFCHVLDVAEAFLQACHTPDVGGECFYIGDEVNYAPPEFEAILAAAVGTRPRAVLRMPTFLVSAAAELGERLTWWRSHPPALNRDKARDLTAGVWSMDVSRAQGRLSWSPRIDLRAGMAETAAWYRRQGWL